MTPAPPRRASLSSWAVHRWLRYRLSDAPESPLAEHLDTSRLLELPAAAANAGFFNLEVCHFHLPRFDSPRLEAFRQRANEAGVKLFSLLIDAGDITHPEHHARDAAWIEDWVGVASSLGFERTRVIAGKQAYSAQAMTLAEEHLEKIIARAEAGGVRVTTENWFPLVLRPETLLALLEHFAGRLGLCFDFGNWGGATKYADLRAIAAQAESCHAKCDLLDTGAFDFEDFRRCLEITKAVGFQGPYTLVHGLETGEWQSLEPQLAVVREYL